MTRKCGRSGRREWVLLLALTVLAMSCGGNTSGPALAELRLVASTTGDDIDTDGYTFSLDGGPPQAIQAEGSVVVTGVLPGSHNLSFTGIASNCRAASPGVVVVTLTPGESQAIQFNVTCEPRLQLLANTTGVDFDVAYLAGLDGGPWHLLRASGPALGIPGVPPGGHELRLAGIAPNCMLTGDARRSIIVPADAVVTVPVDVACAATTRRVLFGSTRDGGYDLYVMNADGTNTVRLTDGSRPALHGEWSPDGARIVYMTSAGASGFNLMVMNADGTGSTPLTNDAATNQFPRWSPDGVKIVFEKNGQIWVMDADGSNPHQVRASGHNPSWSPDANQIAFNNGSAVWIMNADGSGAGIIQDVHTYYSAYPAWSPDGTKILFASPRDGAFTDIYVMNADGSGVVRLTHSPAGVLNEDFDWSPDGTKIAFRTNRDSGNPDIYVMNGDGSNPTSIAPNVWDEYGPAWHP
jgi:TolB protein